MELSLPVTKFIYGENGELQQAHEVKRTVHLQLYIKRLTPSLREIILYLSYENMEITYRVIGAECRYTITGTNRLADFISNSPECVNTEQGLPYWLKYSTLADILYNTAFHKTFGDTVVLVDVLDNTDGNPLDTVWVTHYTPTGSVMAYYTNVDGWYTERRNDKSIPLDLNGLTYDMIMSIFDGDDDWSSLFDSFEYAQYVEIEEVEEHAS